MRNEVGESKAASDTINLALPTVTLKINNGAATTGLLQVTLNMTNTNTPTVYMASEVQSFENASWQTFNAAPTFTLSAGAANSVKTVYVKVRNGVGETSTVSDTINLALPTVTLKINNAAASTTTLNTTLNNVTTNTPTEYNPVTHSPYIHSPYIQRTPRLNIWRVSHRILREHPGKPTPRLLPSL